jgi:hypothetical protein
MFKSFVAWLDSYISREEPSSVLKAMIGLMAFAGLLGTIFGSQTIRVGAFVVLIVVAMSIIIVLLDDRRKLTAAHNAHLGLLTQYCELLAERSTKPLVSIENWRQRVAVLPNGDVREVLTINAVALRERVYFIRLKAGSWWDQPERYRNDVKIIARSLTTGGVPGPRWNVTTWWDSMRKVTSVLHLHQPIKYGEHVYFEMIRLWPAKCQPMMRDRHAEDFTLRISSLLKIQQVEYSVTLPPGFDAVYEPIGAGEPNVHLVTETDLDHEGRRVFTWRTASLPTSTKVGIRLELK